MFADSYERIQGAARRAGVTRVQVAHGSFTTLCACRHAAQVPKGDTESDAAVGTAARATYLSHAQSAVLCFALHYSLRLRDPHCRRCSSLRRPAQLIACRCFCALLRRTLRAGEGDARAAHDGAVRCRVPRGRDAGRGGVLPRTSARVTLCVHRFQSLLPLLHCRARTATSTSSTRLCSWTCKGAQRLCDARMFSIPAYCLSITVMLRYYLTF